jgi:four helix bundle protein
MMDKETIKERLKKLAINTAILCQELPYNVINKVYINQIIKCSSSAAANYRAACRGKSKADFINKLRIVEEELDETMFFYEMLAAFNENKKTNFRVLYVEANEFLSIVIASINTTLKNIELNKKSKTD